MNLLRNRLQAQEQLKIKVLIDDQFFGYMYVPQITGIRDSDNLKNHLNEQNFITLYNSDWLPSSKEYIVLNTHNIKSIVPLNDEEN